MKRLEAKKKKTKEIIRLLKKYYPDAHCALNFETPLELLIATILSAQCTDERVNIVTSTLFKEFPRLEDYAERPVQEIEAVIRSTGFYKNKAKNIQSMARALLEKHNGEVPQNLDDLVGLAGVGRKTANVVMGNAFNIATGVVVDTHVKRLSGRLGLAKEKTPEKIELELQEIVPEKDWIMFSHWLIWHGRKICKARKPQCMTCFLDEICPKKI